MSQCKMCILVLVGIPAAGKTTFCNQLLKHNDVEIKIDIFTYDDLCMDYSSASRKFVFSRIENYISKCASETKEEQYIIVVDDNMYYKSMRAEYLGLAKKFSVGFLQFYFNVELATAIERNSKRVTKKVPEPIITSMFETIEIPDEHVFTIDSNKPYDKTTFTQSFDKILSAINNPMVCISKPSLPEPQPVIELGNSMQSVDIILRKIVHDKIMQNLSGAKKYNAIKQIVYKRVKAGHVNINEIHANQLEDFLLSFFDI